MIERNPYVPWAAQRPAFMHPVFNGVVHPDLPVWVSLVGFTFFLSRFFHSPAHAVHRPQPKPKFIHSQHTHEYPLSLSLAPSMYLSRVGGGISRLTTFLILQAGETGPSAPPEPPPESFSASPRVTRLSQTEMTLLPEFHVQTLAGSRCRSIEEARDKIKSASEAGASALLMVSGDGEGARGDAGERRRGMRKKKGGGGDFFLDSLSLLREARSLREAGEIDEDITIACVANPTAEGGGSDGTARLEAKIEAGAELVITQPALIPSRHRAWWDGVKRQGLDRETEIVFGVALSTSSKSLGFWMRLAGSAHLPGAEEVIDQWAQHEAEMSPETFQARMRFHHGHKHARDYVLVFISSSSSSTFYFLLSSFTSSTQPHPLTVGAHRTSFATLQEDVVR